MARRGWDCYIDSTLTHPEILRFTRLPWGQCKTASDLLHCRAGKKEVKPEDGNRLFLSDYSSIHDIKVSLHTLHSLLCFIGRVSAVAQPDPKGEVPNAYTS